MMNLFPYENHVRLVIGVSMMMYAIVVQIWWLSSLGIILIYTGALRYCPIFHAFRINYESAKRTYHLSLLPKNNPEPVYLFDTSGNMVFRNDSAIRILPNLLSLEDFKREGNSTSLPNKLGQKIAFFKAGNNSYLLHYRPIPNTDLISAFGFDVTKLQEASDEIINTQKELLYRMGEIGEMRSTETGYHVKRVANYTKELALLAGMEPDEAELMKIASPMHDIGKVAIPDRILLKPGKLNKEEWEIMKTHASIGCQLLDHSEHPILQAASIIAGQHHEKWDGTGYPNGYIAKDTHIYGRIAAIVDVFDALGSDRCYKKAWSLDDILDFMSDQKGKYFDPELLDLFLQNQDAFLSIRDKYSD